MALRLHFDVTISDKNVENDLRKIFPRLRPEWNVEDVKFKETPREIKAGLLNLMVVAFVSSDKKDAIMFRIRRNEKLSFNDFLNRDNEIKNISLMRETQNFHFVSNILATFQNGFCYDYIHGTVMTAESIRLEPNWRTIAKQLALIHSMPLDDKLKHQISKFDDFLDKIVYPDELSDPNENEIFQKLFPKKDLLLKECKRVIEHINQLNCQNLFCHNDTRPENMVWNQETGKITFVDWECASIHSQAFEIAYHFRSYTGNEDINVSDYPDKDFQSRWFRVYLQTYYGVVNPHYVVTDDDVEKLYVQVSCNYLFLLIQSVFWVAMIEEFRYAKLDIINICVQNYEEYQRIKDEILELKIPK